MDVVKARPAKKLEDTPMHEWSQLTTQNNSASQEARLGWIYRQEEMLIGANQKVASTWTSRLSRTSENGLGEYGVKVPQNKSRKRIYFQRYYKSIQRRLSTSSRCQRLHNGLGSSLSWVSTLEPILTVDIEWYIRISTSLRLNQQSMLDSLLKESILEPLKPLEEVQSWGFWFRYYRKLVEIHRSGAIVLLD